MCPNHISTRHATDFELGYTEVHI